MLLQSPAPFVWTLILTDLARNGPPPQRQPPLLWAKVPFTVQPALVSPLWLCDFPVFLHWPRGLPSEPSECGSANLPTRTVPPTSRPGPAPGPLSACSVHPAWFFQPSQTPGLGLLTGQRQQLHTPGHGSALATDSWAGWLLTRALFCILWGRFGPTP